MIGVNSNLFISEEQVKLFFETYSLDENNFIDLNYDLNLSKPSLPEYIYIYIYMNINRYPSKPFNLKIFQSSLLSNKSFIGRISELRQDISYLTLDFDEIDEILMRSYFYYRVLNNNDNSIKENKPTSNNIYQPTESCLSKVHRLLFTSKPDPYHCDFSIDTKPDKVKSDIISQIKLKFCYSRKSSSTCFKTSYTSKSLRLRKKTETKIIYPVSSSSTYDKFSPSKIMSSANKYKIYPLDSSS